MNEDCLSFDFINDPGHGWLKVPFDLIKKFGLQMFISNFSYQNGNDVYLEEDCDANLLLKALHENNIKYVIKYIHTDELSEVRNMDYYRV